MASAPGDTMRNRKKQQPAEAAPVQAPPRPVAPLQGKRLPPFSGDRTACTKCGHQGAYTKHFNSGQSCTHNGEGPRFVWGLERLHRICHRCGFAWDEHCVPAIPQEISETKLMPAIRTARGR